MAAHRHDDNLLDRRLQSDTGTAVDEPGMYKVILHNDHYTTMDFVVEILTRIFQKSAADATRIMLDVHEKGQGICGIYTYDIAVTKTSRVHQMAKRRNFPLKCSYEQA